MLAETLCAFKGLPMSVVLTNKKFESHPARALLLLLFPVGAIMTWEGLTKDLKHAVLGVEKPQKKTIHAPN